MNIYQSILLVFFLIVFPLSSAQAYIDPGTGSLALQFLMALLFGALFYIKKIFAAVSATFKKMVSRNK